MKIINKLWNISLKTIKRNTQIRVERIENKKRKVKKGDLYKYIKGKSKENIENKNKEQRIEEKIVN